MKVFKACFITLSTLGLLACSNVERSVKSYENLLKASTEQDGKACVRQRSIRGFGMLADDVVSVEVLGKPRYYLMTTRMRCDSLHTHFSAGFKSDFFEICGGANDKIVTAEESCTIDSVFAFDTRDAALEAFNNAKQIRVELRRQANTKNQ